MRVDLAWLDQLAAVDTDRAQWAASLLEHYVRVYLNAGEATATLHDPLAAAIALDRAWPAGALSRCRLSCAGSTRAGAP